MPPALKQVIFKILWKSKARKLIFCKVSNHKDCNTIIDIPKAFESMNGPHFMFFTISWQLCRSYNVVLALPLQYPWYAVRWIYYQMSKQCWTNVVILTWWHQSRYNVMYWICDVVALPQRCDTFALPNFSLNWRFWSQV